MTLDCNEFKTWLESKNSEDIVGISHESGCCPIATWLKQTGASFPCVGGAMYCEEFEEGTSFVDQHWHSQPRWAEKFIEIIDDSDAGYEKPQPVNAKHARNVLNEILAQSLEG